MQQNHLNQLIHWLCGMLLKYTTAPRNCFKQGKHSVDKSKQHYVPEVFHGKIYQVTLIVYWRSTNYTIIFVHVWRQFNTAWKCLVTLPALKSGVFNLGGCILAIWR